MTILAARPFRFAGADIAPGEPVRGANGEQLTAKLYGQLTRRHWIRVVDGDELDEAPTLPADLGPSAEALVDRALRSAGAGTPDEGEPEVPHDPKVTPSGTARRKRTQEQ